MSAAFGGLNAVSGQGLATAPGQQKRAGARTGFHPDRVIVRFKESVSESAKASAHRKAKTKGKKRFERLGAVELRHLEPGADLKAVLAAYQASGLVEYAEPDYEVSASAVPNDPIYANAYLWQHDNWAQSGGTSDADMDTREAWDTRTTSGAIVAVIDSGVRYTHEDLAANMWRNPREIAGNNVDDDANGYVDDVHGINAITGSGNPWDDVGHGTHVAGTVGAVGNNGRGGTGVAWNVKIMALKHLGADGYGYSSDAIEAIEYARANGASVLNLSWGGPGFSQAMFDALNRSRAAGILVVAAAGNEANNNDASGTYPANYALDNIVAVAATTRTDALASFSNYGAQTVDLAAPGDQIASTYHSGDASYVLMSGTSMATPQVAGVFALLRAHFPAETYLQLASRVLQSVDVLPSLSGKTRTGGRVNLAKALRYTPPATAPAAPSGLKATAASAGAISLTWTDTSNDETGFEIERGLTSTAFTRIATVGANVASFSSTGLSAGTTYHYRVRAVANATPSAYSNVASVATLAATTVSGAAARSQDIGAVAAAGSTSESNGVITMTASGADIWGTADEFRYRYQVLTGDGTIVARVTSLQNTDSWAKAGVMMRENLTAGSRNVAMFMRPQFSGVYQARDNTNGTSTSISGAYSSPPSWVKLVRTGSLIAAYQSHDGVNWIHVATRSTTLPAQILIGLAVTSHRDGTLTTATFDRVSVSGTVTAP